MSRASRIEVRILVAAATFALALSALIGAGIHPATASSAPAQTDPSSTTTTTAATTTTAPPPTTTTAPPPPTTAPPTTATPTTRARTTTTTARSSTTTTTAPVTTTTLATTSTSAEPSSSVTAPALSNPATSTTDQAQVGLVGRPVRQCQAVDRGGRPAGRRGRHPGPHLSVLAPDAPRRGHGGVALGARCLGWARCRWPAHRTGTGGAIDGGPRRGRDPGCRRDRGRRFRPERPRRRAPTWACTRWSRPARPRLPDRRPWRGRPGWAGSPPIHKPAYASWAPPRRRRLRQTRVGQIRSGQIRRRCRHQPGRRRADRP